MGLYRTSCLSLLGSLTDIYQNAIFPASLTARVVQSFGFYRRVIRKKPSASEGRRVSQAGNSEEAGPGDGALHRHRSDNLKFVKVLPQSSGVSSFIIT
jgi:hypothetical protein